MAQAQNTKEYYSPAGMYMCRITSGNMIQTPDGFRRVNEKIAQFQPVAVGDWGRYQTSDPEEITALDERIDDGTGMVLTAQQFMDKTTPDSVKVDQLRMRVQELEGKNRLQEQMARK